MLDAPLPHGYRIAYLPAAYVRLAESVNENEALDVFDRLMAVAAAEPRILEIKRPRRPSQA